MTFKQVADHAAWNSIPGLVQAGNAANSIAEQFNMEDGSLARAQSIRRGLDNTLKNIAECKGNVRLVAVSKAFPASDIQYAYAAGQRDFGENYARELVEKHNLVLYLWVKCDMTCKNYPVATKGYYVALYRSPTKRQTQAVSSHTKYRCRDT